MQCTAPCPEHLHLSKCLGRHGRDGHWDRAQRGGYHSEKMDGALPPFQAQPLFERAGEIRTI